MWLCAHALYRPQASTLAAIICIVVGLNNTEHRHTAWYCCCMVHYTVCIARVLLLLLRKGKGPTHVHSCLVMDGMICCCSWLRCWCRKVTGTMQGTSVTFRNGRSHGGVVSFILYGQSSSAEYACKRHTRDASSRPQDGYAWLARNPRLANTKPQQLVLSMHVAVP